MASRRIKPEEALMMKQPSTNRALKRLINETVLCDSSDKEVIGILQNSRAFSAFG
jgi:hypothetical protein